MNLSVRLGWCIECNYAAAYLNNVQSAIYIYMANTLYVDDTLAASWKALRSTQCNG